LANASASTADIENPGALAGATGAVDEAGCFKTEEYRSRAAAATALCHAIADCHRDDAVVLMSAALSDLSAGAPPPRVWVDALDDARWWARFATPMEHKAYALACFEALRPKSQAAFLAKVQGRIAA
jgi:hypothetical protein